MKEGNVSYLFFMYRSTASGLGTPVVYCITLQYFFLSNAILFVLTASKWKKSNMTQPQR